MYTVLIHVDINIYGNRIIFRLDNMVNNNNIYVYQYLILVKTKNLHEEKIQSKVNLNCHHHQPIAVHCWT